MRIVLSSGLGKATLMVDGVEKCVLDYPMVGEFEIHAILDGAIVDSEKWWLEAVQQPERKEPYRG